MGWPSRWGHFSGPGGRRTAPRVPFPRVRFRPLCREGCKSGLHDPGECPGRNFARGPGGVRPKQRKKKVEGYPSTCRFRADLNPQGLTNQKVVFQLKPLRGFAAEPPPAPKGRRGTSARLRKQVDDLVGAQTRIGPSREYEQRRAMPSCRPRRDIQAQRACSSCSTHQVPGSPASFRTILPVPACC